MAKSSKKDFPLTLSASLNEKDFWEWAETIPVASRDTGFAPLNPWGTQKDLIHQIFEGLNRGVHQFVVLKGGQVGATSALQLLTLFWFHHSPGLQGVCVADSDEVREWCRDQFTLMAMNEPDAPPPEELFRLKNKNQISWDDGARLMFMTSGVRSGSRLGVGRGVAFVHGTEVALWQNPHALTYLRTRQSEKHPNRLYVYESTARGKNWAYDLWTESEDAVDIQRIFLGWWRRDDYILDPNSKQFKRYWDGKMTVRERQWAEALERNYHVTLKPEQWAWHRWYVAEKAAGDVRIADQEEPTLPHDAFEATGQSFLGQELIIRCRTSVKQAEKAECYRYEFGARLEESKLLPTTQALADLLVWEHQNEGDAYVVAAAPAHSSTPECATSAASVWKATRDELIQVAEFASTTVGLQTFSWVLVHLLSFYNVSRRSFMLEVGGNGMGVLQEIKRLQQSGWGTRVGPVVRTLIGPIHHYLWRRPDSLGGGLAMQWKSSGELAGWLLRRLKDQIENGAVRIKSDALLSELERMRQIADKFESEGRVIEEHRLYAAALAVESWASQLVPLFRKTQGSQVATTVMGRTIEHFFSKLQAGVIR